MPHSKRFKALVSTRKSGCRYCDSEIQKQELKLQVFRSTLCGNSWQSYHPECMFKSFTFRMTVVIKTEDDMEGYTDLEQKHQGYISALIKNYLPKYTSEKNKPKEEKDKIDKGESSAEGKMPRGKKGSSAKSRKKKAEEEPEEAVPTKKGKKSTESKTKKTSKAKVEPTTSKKAEAQNSGKKGKAKPGASKAEPSPKKPKKKIIVSSSEDSDSEEEKTQTLTTKESYQNKVLVSQGSKVTVGKAKQDATNAILAAKAKPNTTVKALGNAQQKVYPKRERKSIPVYTPTQSYSNKQSEAKVKRRPSRTKLSDKTIRSDKVKIPSIKGKFTKAKSIPKVIGSKKKSTTKSTTTARRASKKSADVRNETSILLLTNKPKKGSNRVNPKSKTKSKGNKLNPPLTDDLSAPSPGLLGPNTPIKPLPLINTNFGSMSPSTSSTGMAAPQFTVVYFPFQVALPNPGFHVPNRLLTEEEIKQNKSNDSLGKKNPKKGKSIKGKNQKDMANKGRGKKAGSWKQFVNTTLGLASTASTLTPGLPTLTTSLPSTVQPILFPSTFPSTTETPKRGKKGTKDFGLTSCAITGPIGPPVPWPGLPLGSATPFSVPSVPAVSRLPVFPGQVASSGIKTPVTKAGSKRGRKKAEGENTTLGTPLSFPMMHSIATTKQSPMGFNSSPGSSGGNPLKPARKRARKNAKAAGVQTSTNMQPLGTPISLPFLSAIGTSFNSPGLFSTPLTSPTSETLVAKKKRKRKQDDNTQTTAVESTSKTVSKRKRKNAQKCARNTSTTVTTQPGLSNLMPFPMLPQTSMTLGSSLSNPLSLANPLSGPTFLTPPTITSAVFMPPISRSPTPTSVSGSTSVSPVTVSLLSNIVPASTISDSLSSISAPDATVTTHPFSALPNLGAGLPTVSTVSVSSLFNPGVCLAPPFPFPTKVTPLNNQGKPVTSVALGGTPIVGGPYSHYNRPNFTPASLLRPFASPLATTSSTGVSTIGFGPLGLPSSVSTLPGLNPTSVTMSNIGGPLPFSNVTSASGVAAASSSTEDAESEESEEEVVVSAPTKKAPAATKTTDKKTLSEDAKQSFRDLQSKVQSGEKLTVADFSVFTVNELKLAIKLNDRSTTGNKTDLAKNLVDYMTNGCPPRCPECGGGRLKTRGQGKALEYYCPGFMEDDEFVNCAYTADVVVRIPWKSP